MKQISMAIFWLFCLWATPVVGQEFYVDPETGEPKLAQEDPRQPTERVLSEKSYDLGEKTYAIPYDPSSNEEWSLPVLREKEYLELNKAAIAISKGSKQDLETLKKYELKSGIYLWNLLKADLTTQKKVAPIAAKNIKESMGESLIFKLLLSPQKEVRDPAWAQVERLSAPAKLGVWVHNKNKNVRQSIIEELLDKKSASLYQKVRDSHTKKDGYKNGFAKKNPDWLVHLYIDYLLSQEKLPWQKKNKKENKNLVKSINKLLKSSKANKDWKLLANIRLGQPVNNLKKLKKISQNKDWYLRAAVCRALIHRPDLAWQAAPLLLERQRDYNFFVREQANKALVALHSLPYIFEKKRLLKFDNEVILGWEGWWNKQKDLSKLIKSIAKVKPTKLKLVKNKKVFFGASPQNFDVLTGKAKAVGSLYLIDANKDGDFGDFGVDRITLGTNIEKEPSVLLSRIISNNKKLFLIEINSNTQEVKFKPYKGKTAFINFESKYAPKHKPVGIVASSAPDMNFLVQKGKTLLPVGNYHFSAGWVTKQGSEAARIIETSNPTVFEVTKDTTDPVIYGADLSFELETQFDSKEKSITLKPVDVVGRAGEIYRKINPKLQKIEVSVFVNEKKDLKRRDWTPTYINISTQMLGGLVPPLEEGQVPAYRVQHQKYQASVIAHNILSQELVVLKSLLSQKENLAESKHKTLTAAKAFVESPENAENPLLPVFQKQIDTLEPEIIVLLQEVSDLKNAHIPKKETELNNKQIERDGFKNFLDAGAGLTGKSYESFIEAIHREEGVKFLARSMSDIVWRDFKINLREIKGAPQAEKIDIKLKGEVPFGNIEEKTITIPLK